MNRSLFESKKPLYNPNIDYVGKLVDELKTHNNLKVCLGEALIQIDEI
jgi:hypothetical protein